MVEIKQTLLDMCKQELSNLEQVALVSLMPYVDETMALKFVSFIRTCPSTSLQGATTI